MKISHLLENEKPKKPTKTKTKNSPDLSAFQQQQPDQPLANRKPEQEKPTTQPETPAMPRASQSDTLRATQNIRPTGDMMNMLSRMRDIQGAEDDEGYPEQEMGTDLTIRSSQDLPRIVGRAMSQAGFANPDWHTVANLPGNMGAGIRRLGKELFKSFTRTPTNNITMIGNVAGQGPNNNSEINAVAKWLMDNGTRVSTGNIDFADSIPGYDADILIFDAAGARFLIVKDQFGRYIYTWPQQESVGVDDQQPRLNEISDKLAGDYYGAVVKKHLEKAGMRPGMYDRIEKDFGNRGKQRKAGVDRAVDRLFRDKKLSETDDEMKGIVITPRGDSSLGDRNRESQIIDMAQEVEDAVRAVEFGYAWDIINKLTTEEHMFLWDILPSDVRGALKANRPELEENDEVIDRPPTRTPQREEVPVHMPGGSTVVIFNDGKTPAEVVVEAIVAATGLSPAEAFARMMRAHQGGWAPIAAYASRDVAETKAEQIMQHARSNTNYDHYRQHPALRNFTGPWPLHAEVMDADGAGE